MSYENRIFISDSNCSENDTLDNRIVQRAIKLLFNEYISEEQNKKIAAFIRRQHKKHSCVALYISTADRNSETQKPFLRLCNNLNIDPGRREVIICENGKLLFSGNYSIAPKEV